MKTRTRQRLVAGGASLAIACVTLLSGCQQTAHVSGSLPPPAPRTGHGAVRVGAARADLTPPPGFPMGGHSIGGAVSRGVWTRLCARAIYLEDGDGSCLALVACELWSMSGSLADRVAELVAASPAGAHLARERIVLAGTHTHHSPAAFTAHTVYATNAARLSGFDPDLHEFLARRIADCVLAAVGAARPAQLSFDSSAVGGVRRNRSIEAFRLDPEAAQILGENAAVPPAEPSPAYPDPDAPRAVDPRLSVLTARGDDGSLIAVAAFTAVHPTGMRAGTAVYHGDLFAVAAVHAEQSLDDSSGARRPVVALFNGAEGDVSPLWWRQDRIETVRSGTVLGDALVALVRGPAARLAPPKIEGAFGRVPIADQSWVDEQQRTHATAPDPVPGAGQLGGAEDGRTFLFDLGWVEGVRGTRRHGANDRRQGVKLPALEPALDLEGTAPLVAALLPDLTHLVAPPESFPATVPLAVYRLGDLCLATLPGEFTTVMGRRVASAVAERAHVAPARVLLLGLANEYVSYFTTPEEYEAQQYEGASTLYGAESGPWIAHNLAQLASAVAPAVGRTARGSYAYSVKPVRHFGLADLGEPPLRHDDGLEPLIVDERHVPRRDWPHVEWSERRRELHDLIGTAGDAVPFVVVRDDAGRAVADAAGIELVTVALRVDGDTVEWTCIWLQPRAPAGRYTFARRNGDGSFDVLGSADWQPPDRSAR
ncbi:MAG TPA: neutral/alkaline non-lysosomal ceramidase N-terminal domain-containing protein [Planctomycetota bacterium]|nr:neutral/alkaline non-lysosomal ceramidase N-terminal domain-containing protein [Planctomycetota bacterium]